MKHANIALFIPHAGCPHACAFCNQRTISGASQPVTPGQAENTVRQAVSELGERAKNAQLAFFGGSFTAIDRAYMTALLDAVYPFVKRGEIAGLRCSTRPDYIDGEVLSLLKSRGMETIELGAQSMVDGVLRKNERGHTSDDVRNAARLIKEYGFELGLQMMTGLYGDSDEGAIYTARELAALEPDCVRIYPTVVLRGTRLAELYEKGEYDPPGVEESVPLCAGLLDYFTSLDIPVIKLGLHAEKGVEKGYVAGCYHPAFRELCESRLMLERAIKILKEKNNKKAVVYVSPKSLSKMIGQKRKNIDALRNMGYDVTVAPDGELDGYEIKIKPE